MSVRARAAAALFAAIAALGGLVGLATPAHATSYSWSGHVGTSHSYCGFMSVSEDNVLTQAEINAGWSYVLNSNNYVSVDDAYIYCGDNTNVEEPSGGLGARVVVWGYAWVLPNGGQAYCWNWQPVNIGSWVYNTVTSHDLNWNPAFQTAGGTFGVETDMAFIDNTDTWSPTFSHSAPNINTGPGGPGSSGPYC